MIKTIENFNPFDYEGYFLLDNNNEFTIEFFSSNGYLAFEDYDIYKFENFSIIAFYDIRENVWLTNLKISQQDSTSIIQGQFYENVKDTLEGTPEGDNVLYIFLNSLEIKPLEIYNNIAFNAEERCDFNKFGPHSFYPKIKQDSVKITGYKNVLSVTGTAHISRLEIESIESAYAESTISPLTFSTSRTFSGLLKTIREWQQVTESPWNNSEDIAVKSSEFFNQLKIEQQALEETFSEQCNMRVSRYINGEQNLAKKLPESSFISESLNQHFRQCFRYRSIKALSTIHPLGFYIPAELLQKEEEIYREYISYYCLANNIDELDFSLMEIYDHVGQQSHYVETNNSVRDVIKKIIPESFI